MPYKYGKHTLTNTKTGKVYHTKNPHKLAKQHEMFKHMKANGTLKKKKKK